jgi:hypothetical protein
MESLLAYYVVGQLEENGAKVQLPTASAYGVYLPSRLIVGGLIRVYMFTSHREDVLLTSWAIGKAHLVGTEQIVTSWMNLMYLKGIHMVVEFDYTLW